MYFNFKYFSHKRFPADEIVERALSEVGKRAYHIVTKNCEHFANWCRYGIEKSKQVSINT